MTTRCTVSSLVAFIQRESEPRYNWCDAVELCSRFAGRVRLTKRELDLVQPGLALRFGQIVKGNEFNNRVPKRLPIRLRSQGKT